MTTYFVLSASSGSTFTVGQLAGSGSPRIFDGTAIYVYQMNDAVWTTRDFGSNWINIIPSGIGWVSTLCQTAGEGSNTTTFVTSVGSETIPTRYQNYPEISTWTSGSPVPSGNLSNSESSAYGDLPILIGNFKVANAARVWRTDFTPPYPSTASDTGFPTTARVTDIDVGE